MNYKAVISFYNGLFPNDSFSFFALLISLAQVIIYENGAQIVQMTRNMAVKIAERGR